MTRLAFFFIILFLSVFSTDVDAQLLEENNSVVFMKANVLYNTDRYDEAIRLYNRILRDDRSFSRALFMRGKAKYALGAFKGTKEDFLEYIDQKGINVELLEIMADTELKLGNKDNAMSYYEVLHKVLPYEGKYYSAAGEIAYDNEQRNKACEYWIKAAQLGDTEGAKRASIRCGYDATIHLPSRKEVKTEMHTDESVVSEVETKKTPNTEVSTSDDLKEEETNVRDSKKVIDVSVHPTPIIDKTVVNEIEVDDELTILITDGLGERKLQEFPNILMLSDKSGQVGIRICVDGEGKVVKAELQDDKTTIYRSSLSSLALRKAKEFVFIPSLLSDSQCGLLIFSINTDR